MTYGIVHWLSLRPSLPIKSMKKGEEGGGGGPKKRPGNEKRRQTDRRENKTRASSSWSWVDNEVRWLWLAGVFDSTPPPPPEEEEKEQRERERGNQRTHVVFMSDSQKS